mmetsp:Transcript_94500/g.252829  ORF Transcript_94500/g.252829 Transcript_94500/m.252829 type:complete len:332 (-) Transcript_94500:803-1798(-)
MVFCPSPSWTSGTRSPCTSCGWTAAPRSCWTPGRPAWLRRQAQRQEQGRRRGPRAYGRSTPGTESATAGTGSATAGSTRRSGGSPRWAAGRTGGLGCIGRRRTHRSAAAATAAATAAGAGAAAPASWPAPPRTSLHTGPGLSAVGLCAAAPLASPSAGSAAASSLPTASAAPPDACGRPPPPSSAAAAAPADAGPLLLRDAVSPPPPGRRRPLAPPAAAPSAPAGAGAPPPPPAPSTGRSSSWTAAPCPGAPRRTTSPCLRTPAEPQNSAVRRTRGARWAWGWAGSACPGRSPGWGRWCRFRRGWTRCAGSRAGWPQRSEASPPSHSSSSR